MMEYHCGIRPPKHGIYTIGYLDANDHNEFSWRILEGMTEASRRLGIHLIRFGYFTESGPGDSHHEQLLSLMDQADLDGLVFLGWTQAALMYNRQLFSSHFAFTPLLSVGTNYDDLPSVFCVGSDHIRQMVLHLIRRHGFRHIAYMPSERPDMRVEVWKDTLRENGIWFPELQIDDGEWGVSGSVDRTRRFLEILLDERKLDLDAVVSCGEYETRELMQEFERRHLRIPDDITLIGYEDSDFERYSQPGITTVDYPWSEMGFQACTQMIRMLQTGSVPQATKVPGHVIFRGSCGCVSDSVRMAEAGAVVPAGHGLADMTGAERGALLAELSAAYPFPGFDFSRLLDTLAADCTNGRQHLFLPEWSRQLACGAASMQQARLETMAVHIRKSVMPWLRSSPQTLREAGDIFRRAQAILMGSISRAKGQVEIQAKNLRQAMQETSQAILIMHTRSTILASLMESLPKLDIPFCAVVFLERDNGHHFDSNQTILIRVDRQEMETIPNLPAGDLFRLIFPDAGAGRFFDIHPLQASGKWMGYVLFEPGPVDEMVYRTLATHLATAFTGAEIVERLEENNRRLVKQAYHDGRADLIAQVLHNIGNEFNSVNASVQILTDEVRKSPIPDLLQAEILLRSHFAENLESESGQMGPQRQPAMPKRPETGSSSGRTLLKLMSFFRILGQSADRHRAKMLRHLDRIAGILRGIDEIITIQQTRSSDGSVPESDPASVHVTRDVRKEKPFSGQSPSDPSLGTEEPI